MRYEELKIGTQVKCLDGHGWQSFNTGGIYTVTELWEAGVDLDGVHVACLFFDNFEVVE